MKRKIFAVVLVVAMLASFVVTGSAKTYGLNFESVYDAEQNLVTVQLYIEAPGATQSGDISFAYDPAVYEYVDYDDSKISSDLMVVAGKSVLDEGLVTCSYMFTEKCEDKDLDENGNLMLVSFSFKPVKEEYDIENFCMWATSYYISDTDVVNAVSPVGNIALKENHTVVVTAPSVTSPSANKKNEGGSKWYIYVIAGVVAVGAVTGIAVIAIKNNQSEEDAKAEKKSEEKNDSSEK